MKKSKIITNAVKILGHLIDNDAMAGRNVKVKEIFNSVGLTEKEFASADAYLLQQKYVEGTMGGMEGYRRLTGRGVDFYEENSSILEITSNNKEVDNMPDTKKVFIVHGRDTRLRDDFFSFLRALGLQPIEWSEALKLTGKATPYTGEALESAFKNAQAVIVLLSPDDEVRLSPELWKDNEDENEKEIRLQARPNVLFEAGMAFGTYPDRTLLVDVGPLKSFSDVAGRHVVRLSDSPETRNEIAERLRTAGCDVSTSGSDWLTIGNFTVMRKIGKANVAASKDGWVGTLPHMWASSVATEDTFIKIFNNSSADGEVTVDVTPGDGRVVEGVSLGTIPARTIGIFWAATIAADAGVPLNSAFGAVFTVNAPKDSVTAMAKQKRPGGMDRDVPVYTGEGTLRRT